LSRKRFQKKISEEDFQNGFFFGSNIVKTQDFIKKEWDAGSVFFWVLRVTAGVSPEQFALFRLAESAAFVNTGGLPLVYDDMQSVYVAQIVLFVLDLNLYQPVSGRPGYLDRFIRVQTGPFFFLGWKIKRIEF
jgi:hypothetical protein